MENLAKVSMIILALIVASGIIWVAAGVAFGSLIEVAYSTHRSLALAGVGTGYPANAVSQLVWDQFYINLYTVVIGLLAIIVGLKAFKRGETWAWYAIMVFVLNGVITSVFDYLSWGGWYTIFSTLPALLALLLSAKSFFPRRINGEK